MLIIVFYQVKHRGGSRILGRIAPVSGLDQRAIISGPNVYNLFPNRSLYVFVYNYSDTDLCIKTGDAIAQIIFLP